MSWTATVYRCAIEEHTTHSIIRTIELETRSDFDDPLEGIKWATGIVRGLDVPGMAQVISFDHAESYVASSESGRVVWNAIPVLST